MEEAADIVINYLGNELFLSLFIVLLMFSINFGYIYVRGIKKLDAYFENGKDYNDTWTISANFRFFKYCRDYMRGRLVVHSPGMRLWMRFNAVGYALLMMFFSSILVVACYLKISSWLS